MRIKVTITHDDGTVQEYEGPAIVDDIEEDETTYIVSREDGSNWEHIVQAPATPTQQDEWLSEQD